MTLTPPTKKKSSQNGFTLIEVMIVIAIIGILAAVAIPNYLAIKNKAYCTATINDALATANALADYFAISSNVSATVTFNPAGVSGRPYITVGTPAGVNTLLLSASTGNVVVASIAGGGFTIVTTETAGNCPQKVIDADSHWSTTGTDAIYSMTL